ncbi:MAG: PD-(D/E)XK nuclease family protein [Planctomycetes bacterium]|nr:PD-(D/E)XK nuclease family protein [Planctomycetota bacterium]
MSCPIKFYARYILGAKFAPTPPMLLGRAVHSALEFLGRRRQLGLTVTLDDVLAEFHESWRSEIEGSDNDLDEKKLQKAVNGAEPMLRAYWNQYADEVPESSELRLEERLINSATREDHGDLTMLGIIDSLVDEGDGLVIVDFKTTARASSASTIALMHRIQMLAYAYLLGRATDHKIKALEVRQIVNKKEPEVAVCRIPLPEQIDFSPMFLVIQQLMQALETNQWMPRYNFMCSSSCEGYGTCTS